MVKIELERDPAFQEFLKNKYSEFLESADLPFNTWLEYRLPNDQSLGEYLLEVYLNSLEKPQYQHLRDIT